MHLDYFDLAGPPQSPELLLGAMAERLWPLPTSDYSLSSYGSSVRAEALEALDALCTPGDRGCTLDQAQADEQVQRVLETLGQSVMALKAARMDGDEGPLHRLLLPSPEEWAILKAASPLLPRTTLAGILLLKPMWLRPLDGFRGDSTTKDASGDWPALLRHLLVEDAAIHSVPGCLLRADRWQEGFLYRSPAPFYRWPLWLLAFGRGLDLRALGIALAFHPGLFEGWWVSAGFVSAFQSGGDGSPAQETLRAEIKRQGGGEALYRALLSCDWTFLDPTDITMESSLLRMENGKPQLDGERLFFQNTVKWWLREAQPRRPEVEMATEETRRLMSWGHHQWLHSRHSAVPFDWSGVSLEEALKKASAFASADASPAPSSAS
ncbi:MAG TPA: hypothetical protein DDZ88_20315 [Verrucomicrobiales bacterium]|nr:hypothetical protein [Verrucomicrobiales bacterium]